MPFGGKDPFGGDMDAWFRNMGIDPADFRRMVEDMQRGLADAFRNMGQDPSKPFVSGFNVRVGPDGKPHFSTFGNKPQVKANPAAGSLPGIPTISTGEREPLTDVIDEGERLAITLEMPGVDRKDINLHMTETELEITVDTDVRKYHKSLRLPVKVDPTTTKATCTNGVLDITVQKVAPSKSGLKIKVD
jgi:HSP20 family protein